MQTIIKHRHNINYRALRTVLEYGIVLNITQGAPCPGAIASLSSLKETPLLGLTMRTSFVNAWCSGIQVLLVLNLPEKLLHPQ